MSTAEMIDDADGAFFGIYANVPALSRIFLEDLTALRRDYPDVPLVASIVCVKA